jgi:hypothetical protein
MVSVFSPVSGLSFALVRFGQNYVLFCKAATSVGDYLAATTCGSTNLHIKLPLFSSTRKTLGDSHERQDSE